MKIDYSKAFFKKNVFRKDTHVFVKIKSRLGTVSIITQEVRELKKSEKIYKFFSDRLGLELRKFSQLSNSKAFQDLGNNIYLQENLNQIDQQIKEFNRKKLFFIPKIAPLANASLPEASSPVKTKPKPQLGKKKAGSSKHKAIRKTQAPKKKILTNQQLISFYRNEGKDICGRKLEDMWQFSHREKEAKHDYIQWLFPLNESSRFNSSAPTLNQELIDQLKEDPIVIENLRKSLKSMLNFYGLKLKSDGKIVRVTGQFRERRKVWLTPGNHNHLRLTRILTSLSLFGLDQEANSLFLALMKIKRKHPNSISNTTMKYWNDWKMSHSL
ncbi:MAG: opioid growth factor receptor-related protein [Parachlamydiaceae bacterium]